ncbi:MAG: SDR family oxidoreductase [Armatimonadetes bacterium]|nr:SDR family oxidoreductase [Armatimonadota bacterium]
MRLRNKTALITGAGAGMGRAASLLFAREGAKVAAVDCAPETGEETVSLIRQAGGEAFFIRADVACPAGAEAMIREAAARWGRLDILFNNAGIVVQGSVEDTSEEEWDRQIDINLKGVFLGCKYAVPVMRAQGGGVIVNMASVAGIIGIRNRAAYSASKGGVIGLTRAVAADHVGDNIRVNCICPGTIETPSLRDRIASAPDPAAARRQYESRQPIGRLGTPEEIAEAALYLASDAAAFMTGNALAIDGGIAEIM